MSLEERRAVVERGRPSGGELARRIAVLVFGLIQVLIGLRILLLLLDAREANAIVKGILDLSQLFVAPFDGILRTDALHASGSTPAAPRSTSRPSSPSSAGRSSS